MRLRLLDLDQSLDAQATLRDAAPWSAVETLPLRDLAPRLRLWARDRDVALARERLADAANDPAVTLIGSGDFHHLAPLVFDGVGTDFTLLHFDNHPDWVRFAPRWHCGSWVNRALEHPRVARVITIGPCSSDLVRPQWKGGNLAALQSGRLVLFPWQHAPSRVWGRIADGPAHRVHDGHIHWQCLDTMSTDAAANAIGALIRTQAVWFSIDKDVLAPHEAATNWDQGRMPLDALLGLVRTLSRGRRVLGADVCGDWSAANHRHVAKWIEARRDQPQERPDAAAERNALTNRRLFEALHEVAA